MGTAIENAINALSNSRESVFALDDLVDARTDLEPYKDASEEAQDLYRELGEAIGSFY